MTGAIAAWVIGAALVTAGPEPAADPIDACEVGLREHADADAYRCFYVAARRGGQYERAAAALERVAGPGDPWPQYVLADLYSDMADERAVALYHRAAAGFAARGDRENEGWVRLSLADAIAAGDLRGAGEQLRLAEQAADVSGDDVLVATVMAERARALTREDGDFVSALVMLDAAERRLGDRTAYQSRLVVAHVRAQALESLDRRAEAVAERRRIAAMAQAAGDVFVETSSWAAMAELTMADPLDRDLAVAYARTSLGLADAHGNAYLAAYAHCLLGELGDGDVGDHFAACLEGAADDPSIAAVAHLGLAWHEHGRDPIRAAEQLALATALFRSGGGEGHEAASLRVALAWQSQDPEAAVATSIEVLDDLESALARQRHAVGRAQFLAQWSPLFHYVAYQMVAGDHPGEDAIDRSLDAIERWRGRVLIEHFDASGAFDAHDGPATRAHADAVDRVDAAYARMLAQTADSPDSAAAQDALRTAEREASATWDAVLAEHPAHATLEISTPRVATIRGVLEPGEALISVQMASALSVPAPDRIAVPAWAWVITRDDAIMVPLPAGPDLDDLVRIHVGAIEARDGTDVAIAVGLHRLLMAPLLEVIGPDIASLVIVPEGELFSLPWATLRASAQADSIGANFEIAVAPSIATLVFLRSRVPPTRTAALVLADPSIPYAPLQALPFARDEALAVAQHLGVSDTRVLVGDAASEAALLETQRPQILHFATHATIDRVHADRQALALAPSPGHDGWLRPHEIARLELDGALVVLAGCRSGDGSIVGGEGPLGLSRAFLLGGARAVVGTHWPVRDDEAARFAASFHAAIADGRSIAAAVARAQGQLRDAGAPTAAWAAFMVLGDGSWRPRPRAPRTGWAWWLAVAALALGATAYAQRRKA